MEKAGNTVNAASWKMLETASETGKNWKHENNSASLEKGSSG